MFVTNDIETMHHIQDKKGAFDWGSLPVATVTNIDVRKMTLCAICLLDPSDGKETYAHNKTCRLLKCNHRFHIDCIKGWFRYGKYQCPYCRSLVSNNEITYIIGDIFRTDKHTQLYWDGVLFPFIEIHFRCQIYVLIQYFILYRR